MMNKSVAPANCTHWLSVHNIVFRSKDGALWYTIFHKNGFWFHTTNENSLVTISQVWFHPCEGFTGNGEYEIDAVECCDRSYRKLQTSQEERELLYCLRLMSVRCHFALQKSSLCWMVLSVCRLVIEWVFFCFLWYDWNYKYLHITEIT